MKHFRLAKKYFFLGIGSAILGMFYFCTGPTSLGAAYPEARPLVRSAAFRARLPTQPSGLQTIKMESSSVGFLQYPVTGWQTNHWYVLSSGGSSVGELLHYGESGQLISRYGKRGYGPEELTHPIFLDIHDDGLFLGESGKPDIHLLDHELNYRENLTLHTAGSIRFTTKGWFGFWSMHSPGKKGQPGYMLVLLDRETGQVVKNLVPFREKKFAIALEGNAVLDGDRIYAVSVNTGCLDMIAVNTWETDRIRLERGVMVPLPWEQWRRKNRQKPSREAVEAWLSSFVRPVDISKQNDRLYILYAEGTRYFYDIHDLQGALLSQNHPVPIPFPRFQGRRVVGVVADEGDRQYFAYLELGHEFEGRPDRERVLAGNRKSEGSP